MFSLKDESPVHLVRLCGTSGPPKIDVKIDEMIETKTSAAYKSQNNYETIRRLLPIPVWYFNTSSAVQGRRRRTRGKGEWSSACRMS